MIIKFTSRRLQIIARAARPQAQRFLATLDIATVEHYATLLYLVSTFS